MHAPLEPSEASTRPYPSPLRRRSRRGQALVELALLLPLLLILVLGAIDFGRVFLGWVALQNAARVGANFAATHPDAWAQSNTAQMSAYEQLIADSGASNCDRTTNDPEFPAGTRNLGDPTRVELSCDFTLLTPIFGSLLGQPITIAADTTFPIRQGCADCSTSGTAPPPPPPANCRTIPELLGTSIQGARLAWVAAGFTGDTTPATGDDGRTVDAWSIDQHGEIGCNGTTNAFFSSTITLIEAPVTEPGPGDTCATVPNLLGMTVDGARDIWLAAGFEPNNFSPTTGADDRIVDTESFLPSAIPGDCEETTLNVVVTSVAAPGPPPAPPCKVPSFVNTQRSAAQGTWNAAGFTTTVQYQPPAQNWTLIKGQSLVGGTWAGCASVIQVLKNG